MQPPAKLAGLCASAQSASSDVLPATTPSVITDSGATVTFSRNDFDTLPGQSFDLLVSWQRPAHSAADIARFPLYSGFVTVTGRGTDGSVIPSETYTVPYNGLNARLFDMPGESDGRMTRMKSMTAILMRMRFIYQSLTLLGGLSGPNSRSWPLVKISMWDRAHISATAALRSTSVSLVSRMR